MSEAVLPGVLIEVRPEGLIVPGAITVGNIGVVGTASKGPVGTPVLLGTYAEAVQRFGTYDRWLGGTQDELTLVRALEQAYRHGATTVFAVRVASDDAEAARTVLDGAGDECVRVTARTPGTWGNDLAVQVEDAEEDALVEDEEVSGTTLAHTPVVSALNRIRVRPPGGGSDVVPTIVYEGPAGPDEVLVDTDTGALTFGTPLDGATVVATYMVSSDAARKVTVRSGDTAETYTVVSGDDLVHDLRASALVEGEGRTNASELPDTTSTPEKPNAAQPLTGGANGADADFQPGLDALLEVDAHIIVAAGQDQGFGNRLATHCENASSDERKRERIAVVGSGPTANPSTELFGQVQSHSLNSPRVIFVAPGIEARDSSQSPPADVTLPGAYTAAAVAGKLSSLPPHVSPTNKVLPVDGLELEFTRAQLKQLVLSRVLALEARKGFRIVKGITTSTNTAWHQITTRRIVDYAKFGVRSAATPYIGLLNNERVRGALRATINSFLSTMVDDEMLISYELEVSATRDEEIRGIASVTLVLRPTFSIDFIKVTMFLE